LYNCNAMALINRNAALLFKYVWPMYIWPY
jgi:hypothetical protein